MKSVGLCVLVTGIFVSNAFASGYVITDIGTLGGNYSRAVGITNAGQVVGNSFAANGNNYAFTWEQQSGIRRLPTLMNGDSRDTSSVSAVNNLGQIIGWSFADVQGVHTCMWNASGQITDLGITQNARAQGYDWAEVSAINDSGMLAGYVYNRNGYRSAVFNSSGSFTLLPGSHSRLFDMSNVGIKVGVKDSRACYWTASNTFVDLGLLSSSGVSTATAVNDSGDIVGFSTSASGYMHAFLWRASLGMVDLGAGVPLGCVSGAEEINNLGYIVGYSQDPITNKSHAAMWDRDGHLVDLNSFLDSGSGWNYLDTATGINDMGQICGIGYTTTGEQHAFVMTPVPEPATLSMFAIGGIALLRRRR